MFMRKKQSAQMPPAEPVREKILEIDSATQGALTFKDPISILISGRFEGSLEAPGTLTIGEKAQVRAHIVGGRVIIRGEMVGDVTASVSLVLTAGGRLVGDVRTPSLTVEEGAVLQGEVNMIASAAGARPGDSRLAAVVSEEMMWDVDQLAAYLSVERSLIFEWADSGRLPGIKNDAGWQFDKRKVDEWVASGKIR